MTRPAESSGKAARRVRAGCGASGWASLVVEAETTGPRHDGTEPYSDTGTMDTTQLVDLYHVMVLAREIDRVERELTCRGEGFFQVSGAGHEGAAVLARHLTRDDWLHCHYRSRALILARGVSPADFLRSFLSKATSSSQGRRMTPFFSDPRLHLMSMVTPVGNNALQAVGVASVIRDRSSRPLVVCGLGDGGVQEGEVLEALCEAAREHLPVLFFVEDNQWAISTRTAGRNFYNLPGTSCDTFCGVVIHRVDGRDVLAADQQLGPIIQAMRRTREPAVVVFQVERLASHSHADDQTVYRDPDDIAQAQENDPLRICAAHLLRMSVSPRQLQQVDELARAQVARALEEVIGEPDPKPTYTAMPELPYEATDPTREHRGTGPPSVVMRDAIRDVLRHHLALDARVLLYGQDIEDPKGDVFGITRGLSSEFPGRVRNAPLSETTILGVCIGQALAGARPVALIQFADFLPVAFNQLMCELATMYWRTAGAWQTPVLVLAPCGAYRPGLGPFHCQTMESYLAHTPGLDVMMPATAADAAGMLNAAFAAHRPTVFLYPKTCLNDLVRAAPSDVVDQFVPLGRARRVRSGDALTFVAWGNTVPLCVEAADKLEQAGIESDVLDLRCLAPWDQQAVIRSAETTGRLIVVHEDNLTCGFGAEVVATVVEKSSRPVLCRRITRPDAHVPYHFGNQLELLPSFRRILEVAAELSDLEVSWHSEPVHQDDAVLVPAIGSSPSDVTVDVIQLLVRPGEEVKRGTPVATLEASKSVFDMTSTVGGQVIEVFARPGDRIAVGAPLFKVKTDERHRSQPMPVSAVLTSAVRRSSPGKLSRPSSTGTEARALAVGISTIAAVEGTRIVRNSDLLEFHTPRTDRDIVQRTGIEVRHWIAAGESVVTLAVQACHQVLEQEGLYPDQIQMLVCSTTSPGSVSPSVGCRILQGLGRGRWEPRMQAYDINAACSGYLYALQSAYDYLQSDPQAKVLVVTTEVLSPLLDPHDFDTAILFGDAASATIVYGQEHFASCQARLFRPELSAKSDVAEALSVPFPQSGFIQMNGRKVFSEAVKTMISSLRHACNRQGIRLEDLAWVIPHQANQRILDAIEQRVKVRVYSNIRLHGNTSSSSIPLCLAEVLPSCSPKNQLGLCAFGGGFTFGASILEKVQDQSTSQTGL